MTYGLQRSKWKFHHLGRGQGTTRGSATRGTLTPSLVVKCPFTPRRPYVIGTFSYSICIFLHKAAVCKFLFANYSQSKKKALKKSINNREIEVTFKNRFTAKKHFERFSNVWIDLRIGIGCVILLSLKCPDT